MQDDLKAPRSMGTRINSVVRHWGEPLGGGGRGESSEEEGGVFLARSGRLGEEDESTHCGELKGGC
jgi:hypothetical protein